MACKKQTFFFLLCFHCLSLVPTLSLLLSLNPSRESAIWQSIPLLPHALHPTSHLRSSPKNTHTHAYRGKSKVNHRDAMSPGTTGHSRVGDQSRCLSLSLLPSLTQPSQRCVLSTHARALVRAPWCFTLTKMYSYRSCPWRLSVSAVSAGRGQSWLVTRSSIRGPGQTINLCCVPANPWTYNSLKALFFK